MDEEHAGKLHVSGVEVYDFKRLREVRVASRGRSLVLIRGQNGEGKTSLLDALVCALAGGRADPAEPIRKGASSASVRVTIADAELRDRYDVAVRWSAKGRSLVVRDLTPEIPAKLSRPQSVLDDIVGRLSFDPLRFLRASRAERSSMLFEALGLSDDFEAYTGQRSTLVSSRTDTKRKRDELERELRGVHSLPIPDDAVPIDVDELRKEIAEAERVAAGAASAKREAEALAKDAAEAGEKVRRLMRELDDAKRSAARLAEVSQDATEAAAALTVPDVSRMVDRLASAAEHNRAIEVRDSIKAKAVALRQAEASVEDIGRQIDAMDSKIRSRLAAEANAAGLGDLYVDADGIVRADGVPFEQASRALQIRTSAALGMRANPTLRIMAIDEADCLDARSLDDLRKIATDHNHQIWLSAVWSTADGDDCETVQIVDGAREGGDDGQ